VLFGVTLKVATTRILQDTSTVGVIKSLKTGAFSSKQRGVRARRVSQLNTAPDPEPCVGFGLLRRATLL
jgi:hypothetical protein